MPHKINQVLVTVTWTGEQLSQLQRIFAPAQMIHVLPHDQEKIGQVLRTCDVAVLRGVANDRFLTAPNLRWIHCDRSGLDAYAPRRLVESGIAVTSASGRSGPVLAEHALFFMLALCYDAKRQLRAQSLRVWGMKRQHELRGLHGRKLCIVGLGATGTELARQAHGFDMDITAYRRRDLPSTVAGVRVFSRDAGEGLGDAMESADFVALCASLNDGSYHMLGEEELKRMRPGGYLVNVARAQLAEPRALRAALRSGHLGGAGLDVADPHEPPPPWDSIWSLPNVILTPHVTPQLPDRTERSLRLIAENHKRCLAGEPMLNRLTAEDVFSRRKEPRSWTKRVAHRAWSGLLRSLTA